MWNFTLKLLFSTLPRVSFCFTVQGSIVKWSTLGHLTLTQKISFQESSYSFRLTRILYMTWQMVSLAQYEVTQNCSISHDSPHHNHIKKDLLSVKKILQNPWFIASPWQHPSSNYMDVPVPRVWPIKHTRNPKKCSEKRNMPRFLW